MKVYGCKISYYTGKLETYLRYRSTAYEYSPTVGNEAKLKAGAGAVQMPVVELDDGRWMSDSTPVIAWLETQQKAPTIYPDNAALNFAALMIEDYADEWLWRSAMHYRWSYRRSRQYAAQALYEDLVRGRRPIPRIIAINILKLRQYFGFVRGDGVNAKSRNHADDTYLKSLDLLQAILERRPYILGDTPTIADFGLMGPMFRHFSMDPTPAEIMRTRAPAVYEWVARMWNSKASSDAPRLIDGIDDVLADLLTEVCETNLSQHRQNANAYTKGLKRYDQIIQTAQYDRVPTSRYRVWCLEELRRLWAELDGRSREQLKSVLPTGEAVAALWDEAWFESSNYDQAREAPFNRAINVFSSGVPPR